MKSLDSMIAAYFTPLFGRFGMILCTIMAFTLGVNATAPLTPSVRIILSGDTRAATGKDFFACEAYSDTNASFEASDRYGCYARTLASLVRTRGVSVTVKEFKSYLATNGGKTLEGARCHALGHEIGSAAVATNRPAGEILSQCADFCGFGCLNGAAHNYILLNQDIGKAQAFCDATSTTPEIHRGCFHGIGHGVAEYTNLDIKRGMRMCDHLTDQEARFQCGHALVMDLRLLEGSGSSPSIPADIPEFCGSLAPVYRNSCYEFTGFLTYARGRDLKTAFTACLGVPSAFGLPCSARIGEALLGEAVRASETIGSQCANAGTDALIRACLFGLNRTITNGIDNPFGELSAQVCGKAPSRVRSACYRDVASLLGNVYGLSVQQKFCNVYDPNHKECLSTDHEAALKK